MEIKLPEKVEKLISIAEKKGVSAFAVGGCVRDSLLNKEPKDWDITISSVPEKTKEIYKDFKTFDTGIKYGTVSVIIENDIFEITTFRGEDEYKDFRHPGKIYFSTDIKEDLKRRDFTVNAMAYNKKEGLIDLFGGKDDLGNKIIRCVRDPKERFFEDPLRILRGIRFASCLGFEIEENTKTEIFCQKELIKHISKERIKAEFDKMLISSENLQKYICEYEDVIKISLNTKDVEKAKKYIDNTKDLSVKWALLLLNSEINKLKLSNELKRECNILKSFEKVSINQNLTEVRYLVKKYGIENVIKIIEFKKAMGENVSSAENSIEEIKEKNLCCSLKQLDFNGNDLTSLGIEEKIKYKEILDYLLNLVIEEKCENKKEELIKKIIV